MGSIVTYVSDPFESIFEHGKEIRHWLKEGGTPQFAEIPILNFFSMIEAFCLYDKVEFSHLRNDLFFEVDDIALLETDPIIDLAVNKGFASIVLQNKIAEDNCPYSTPEEFPDDFINGILGGDQRLLSSREFVVKAFLAYQIKDEIIGMNGGWFDPTSKFFLSLAACSITNGNAYFSYRDAMYYKLNDTQIYRKRKAIVEELYESLKIGIQKDIDLLSVFDPTIKLTIPPFSALVLSRCSGVCDIATTLIEVRDEFEPLRDMYSHYQDILEDPSVSLKDRLELRTEFMQYSEHLSKSYESWDATSISEWSSFSSLIDIDKISEGKIASAIIGKPTKALIELLRRKQIRHFISLKEKYLRIENYGVLLNKKLGIDTDNIRWRTGTIRQP